MPGSAMAGLQPSPTRRMIRSTSRRWCTGAPFSKFVVAWGLFGHSERISKKINVEKYEWRPRSSEGEEVETQESGINLGTSPRDDDVLPDNLTDALASAAEATSVALEGGCERCVVEILLPEFWDPLSGPVYAEEGDQQRFWKLTRRFIDNLGRMQPSLRMRAIYPDAGVAAMLRNKWPDASFELSSLNDRLPVKQDDQLIIVAAPDPPGLDAVIKLSSNLQPGQSLVMFNPRLASGDVGVGLNIRRLRESFLKSFVTTYSLRPIGDVGTVFRRYPGLWQVFVEDKEMPGRYILAAQQAQRPGGEELDALLLAAYNQEQKNDPNSNKELGIGERVVLTLTSIRRFMDSLSK